MIPIDKLKLILDYLQGKGTSTIRDVFGAIIDVLNWIRGVVAPATGTATAQFTIPPFLGKLLLDLGLKLLEKLLAGKAEEQATKVVKVAKVHSAKAKKLAAWIEEVQGQPA